MNQTTFDSFSTELLIDIFEFLNAVDLLRAFDGLNSHLNYLLLIYFRTYRLDFRSIFNKDFNVFCGKYLPSILNRTIYLRISDADDTPFQCAYLLSHGFTLDQFENLRSLTLNCLSPDPTINEVFFSGLHRLHHLTHLKFVDCKLYHVKVDDFQDVIDQIWSLPHLTHLYWHVEFLETEHFHTPTFVSRSLQYLTIIRYYWCSNKFVPLFEKTPRLKKFSITFKSYEADDLAPKEFTPSPQNLSIEKLTLTEVITQRAMINLLQLLPRINHFKVEIRYLEIDGHWWEAMINKYLPQLKVFQLILNVELASSVVDDDPNNEMKVDEYLETYRTPFWIEDHQWFIRCHWGIRWNNLNARIHTLPYQFDYFSLFHQEFHYKTKWTCPDQMNFSYDSVRNVDYDPLLFHDKTFSRIQLNSIEILRLQLPIDHRFFSFIPRFDHLLFLGVILPIDYDQSQFQRLLDNAPRLHSLIFHSWKTLSIPPYQHTSSSISFLDVHGCDKSSRQRLVYNRKQCSKLCKLPLALQCRVLTIEVDDLESLFLLISTLKNLRTLHVYCEYDHRHNKYDVLDVIQSSLPSKWTVTRFHYGCLIIRS